VAGDAAVAVRDATERERYEITVGGEAAGYTAYRTHADLIALVHTEVDPRFQGRGLADRLIRFALHDARARRLGVLPYCPFVRTFIERNPEYAELVPSARRGRFGL
jgi:predicted GNAT family acetyltransferase